MCAPFRARADAAVRPYVGAVAGQQALFERTWANRWGPGRLKEAGHIFVDGALAGLEGQRGCSLGLTMAIWPAVALERPPIACMAAGCD